MRRLTWLVLVQEAFDEDAKQIVHSLLKHLRYLHTTSFKRIYKIHSIKFHLICVIRS